MPVMFLARAWQLEAALNEQLFFLYKRSLVSRFEAKTFMSYPLWRVWRYQNGNLNPYIWEGHTTQWSKQKKTKGQQQKNDTQKIKDRATRTPPKSGGELRCTPCTGRVGSSCPSSGTRRLTLLTNSVIFKSWMGKASGSAI